MYLRKALFLRRLHEGGFFFAHFLVRTHRKLRADFADALDEQRHIGLLLTCFCCLRNNCDVLKLCRVSYSTASESAVQSRDALLPADPEEGRRKENAVD